MLTREAAITQPLTDVAGGRSFPVSAAAARQTEAQARTPARLSQHPGPLTQRRIVPHMLSVTTLEVGDPVVFVIQVEADYLP